jgi:hypothetical protein
MRYRDVLIHTHASLAWDSEYPRDSLPIQRRIDLSDQIWIGPLDDQLAKLVIEACDKRYFGPIPNVRMSRQLYSYVRELSLPDSDWNWDHDHVLETTVALSRLVHPTSAGLLCAARISFDETGKVGEIYPAVRSGISLEVFLSPQRDRNWLTDADAAVLRELVALHPIPLPPRVHNALWHHEYAARTCYINHRWLFVCTGLEALVHTDKGGSTMQFKSRVPALASELGISFSEAEAVDAYDVRCRLAHGLSLLEKGPGGPPLSQMQLYDRIEDILRLAVLRSMREPNFAAIFRDDDIIRSCWPV